MIRDRELAGLAMTLSRDAGIKVTVGGDTSYCTPDGGHIHIARMPATELGRMLTSALVFHEVAHRHYTCGSRPQGLVGEMTNIIEDVRVEDLMIEERPGTRFDLEALTRHSAAQGALCPQDLPCALLGAVMAWGREKILGQKALAPLASSCRRMLSESFGNGFVEDLERLLEGQFAQLGSTAEAQRLAEQILGLLEQQKQAGPVAHDSDQPSGQKPAETALDPDNQDDPPQQESNAGTTEDAGNRCDTGENPQAVLQQPNQECPGADKSADNEQLLPPDEESFPEKGPLSQPAPIVSDPAETRRPSAAEIEAMMGRTGGDYGNIARMATNELDHLAAEFSAQEKRSVPELPAVGRWVPQAAALDEAQALSACSRMRARLLTLLQSHKQKPRAYGSSGRKLARNRLVRMALGDARIFARRTEQKALHTAVMILLDTSGSMIDQRTASLKRYQIANPAAFALHHTLYGLSGVKVATAEFSSRDPLAPQVNLLCDFGEKPASCAFNIDPNGGTPTDRALWYARAALSQRPEPRKLLVLLTDGYPVRHEQTRAATAECAKLGIEIIALGIETDAVRRFWPNHRVISDVNQLPQAIFEVMEESAPGVGLR